MQIIIAHISIKNITLLNKILKTQSLFHRRKNTRSKFQINNKTITVLKYYTKNDTIHNTKICLSLKLIFFFVF